MSDLLVIVVFAPLTHADAVREALAAAGAGQIGEYSACSFSAPGEGRCRPSELAEPHIGTANQLEVVPEMRIECVCPRDRARQAVTAMLAAHPNEEPASHCYPVFTRADL